MFTWLLYNTLCALPLALVALLARRVLRAAPAVEHLLWLLVLVRLVLPPIPGGAAPSAGGATGIIASGTPDLGNRIVAQVTRALGSNWSSWAERVLLVLFLGALAFVVLRELFRAGAVERCVRRSSAAGGELARHVRAVAERLGVVPPHLCVSGEASGPFLWSLRRPVLVLPAYEELPAPTVLAHEFAHLRRRDHWIAWLELVAQGFHFWNPLFWLARRRLHVAAELACDQWVVARFPAERHAFATALVDTAERAALPAASGRTGLGRFVPRAVQAIGMDPRDFEERLVLILRGEARARGARASFAAAFLVAALTLPGWGAPTLARFRQSLPPLPAGIDDETWTESLRAADERLRVDPSDGAAMMQRGVALTGLGRGEEALRAFQRQQELGFQPGKALYNQACAAAVLGDLDSALVCLLSAADLGFDVAGYASVDPDLEPLRAHPDFQELVRAP